MHEPAEAVEGLDADRPAGGVVGGGGHGAVGSSQRGGATGGVESEGEQTEGGLVDPGQPTSEEVLSASQATLQPLNLQCPHHLVAYSSR